MKIMIGSESPIFFCDVACFWDLAFLGLVLGAFLFVCLLFLLLDLLLSLPDGLQVSCDEEIDQDVPVLILLELASEDSHLSCQHPEDGGDGLGDPVVAWDDDVDEVKGSVGVAESDGGDVNVGGLNDGLVVALGVGDDQETGLLELLGDLIGEGSGDPPGGGEAVVLVYCPNL